MSTEEKICSKIKKLAISVMLAICIVINFCGEVSGFSLGVSASKEKMKLNETVIIKVSWDESVSAARN